MKLTEMPGVPLIITGTDSKRGKRNAELIERTKNGFDKATKKG